MLYLIYYSKHRKHKILHYNADNSYNSYLFVNGNEIFKFKTDNKNVKLPTQFCLGSISNGFSNTESREVSVNENLYDFSVGYNSNDKSDILNIHKYLMAKNNINNVLPVYYLFIACSLVR